MSRFFVTFQFQSPDVGVHLVHKLALVLLSLLPFVCYSAREMSVKLLLFCVKYGNKSNVVKLLSRRIKVQKEETFSMKLTIRIGLGAQA